MRWVSSKEVDEPRAYYAEWSKSEGERQILYTNTYVWNLDRVLMTPRAGQQRRHRHEEQTFGLSGEREKGMIWKSSTETYTLPYVKQITSGNFPYDAGSSKPEICDNLEGWDEEGGGSGAYELVDMGMPMADSCWWVAENHCNIIKWLSSN